MIDPSKGYSENMSALFGNDYYAKTARAMGGNSSDSWNAALTGLHKQFEAGNRNDPNWQSQWMADASRVVGAQPFTGMPQTSMPAPMPQPGYQPGAQPQSLQPAMPQSSGNPYLPQQAQAITSQVTNNLQNRILPGINMGASVNGNFGSNRHAIAQGQAIGDTNLGLSNALSGLYANAYESDQNRAQQAALSREQMGLQRDLAGSQLDFSYWNAGNNFGLQNKSMDQGFYTAQRGQDLQQMGLGSQMVNQGNQGMTNAGQGLFNLGMGQQQQSWFPFQQYGGQLAQFGGFGGSTSQTQPGASSFQTGLGGALTAAQLWNLLSKSFGG